MIDAIKGLIFAPMMWSGLVLIGNAWFIWLPLALIAIFKVVWVQYLQGLTLSKNDWILLKVTISRDIAKSPKAMESIFAGLHGPNKNPDFFETHWDGYVNPWFSFEIIGDGKEVHFFIWTQTGFRRMLEASIYAQYPSSEIRIVDDYTRSLPDNLPNKEWDLWGTELILSKPDAYPIRTYEDFVLEDVSSKEEERKIDPLSSLVEFMGALQESENVWIQFLVRASNDKWKEEGEALIAEMAGRKVKKKLTVLEHGLKFIQDVIGFFASSGGGGEEKKDTTPLLFKLTPGQQEIMKAVERNIGKIGFEVGIRIMYLARRDIYNGLAAPAILGIFKQFASPALNGFKLNVKTKTSEARFFKKQAAKRKPRIYQAYRLRSYFYPPYNKYKPFVLSSSELATVYHFPGTVAGAPAITRVEAKKGTPPTNLPM